MYEAVYTTYSQNIVKTTHIYPHAEPVYIVNNEFWTATILYFKVEVFTRNNQTKYTLSRQNVVKTTNIFTSIPYIANNE